MAAEYGRNGFCMYSLQALLLENEPFDPCHRRFWLNFGPQACMNRLAQDRPPRPGPPQPPPSPVNGPAPATWNLMDDMYKYPRPWAL